MNLKDMENAWKNQDEPELHINQQQFMENLQLEQSRFDRVIFWRDFREVAAAILAAILILALRWNQEIMWPAYLSVLLVLGVGAFLLLYAKQWKNREQQYDHSLKGLLEKRSAQIGHQVRLLNRLVIWVYLLPIFVVICLLQWQDSINEGIALSWKNGVVPLGLCLVVYWINWMAARSLKKEKAKIDLELDKLNS